MQNKATLIGLGCILIFVAITYLKPKRETSLVATTTTTAIDSAAKEETHQKWASYQITKQHDKVCELIREKYNHPIASEILLQDRHEVFDPDNQNHVLFYGEGRTKDQNGKSIELYYRAEITIKDSSTCDIQMREVTKL